MIDAILRREEFVDSPPVLLDIGASGAIHPKWKSIAQYCICIAFDADLREMNYAVKESSGYRKLYVFNSVVTDQPATEMDFYLTRSPYCSSLLKPNQESLNNWAFSELFEVDKTIKLKTATLPSILKDAGIEKIDWFKTDSQGTDLRLFKSLGDTLVKKALVAEFEPGIIDAYSGEDKLWNLMSFMDKQPFWMSSLDIIGSQRIERSLYSKRLSRMGRKLLPALLKTSPGWGEVSYFNTLEKDALYLDKRDFLLGWVFAMIEKQYGFAVSLSVNGLSRFGDPVFEELERYALKKMKRGFLFLPFFIMKKVLGRISRMDA